MAKDPYNHKEKYLKWKEKVKFGIPEISKANSDIIKRFINDMEFGLNISVMSKKGARSYIRLNTLRDKMIFFAKAFKERLNLDCITDMTEERIHTFFADMRNGNMQKQNGGNYQSVAYFVKSFKSFWHWYMQVSKKDKKEIPDITVYLDAKEDKPKWVYLSEDDIRKLCLQAKYEYKVLMMFLLDSGIRSPTELVNVKVSDFQDDFKKLKIREETSKTFGRQINILLCSELIKDYVESKEKTKEDYLFEICPSVVNRYLKRLAKEVLGEEKSLAGKKYSELTMYDFRHSSACYWLPRYKSESSLKYRFGWKQSEMIHYYTELLGMKDDITEEDLLIEVTKTELQKQVDNLTRSNEILKEENESMRRQMEKIMSLVKELDKRIARV